VKTNKKVYNERLKRFAKDFSAAYRFLKGLEEKTGNDELRLSPVANAHLYQGNCFIAYILLSLPSQAFPTLTFSPEFNGTPKDEIVNCSGEFFPKVIRSVLERHLVDGVGWWSSVADGAFELRRDTPNVVFEELLDAIRKLPCSGAARPTQKTP
jgi:hypothetical protein